MSQEGSTIQRVLCFQKAPRLQRFPCQLQPPYSLRQALMVPQPAAELLVPHAALPSNSSPPAVLIPGSLWSPSRPPELVSLAGWSLVSIMVLISTGSLPELLPHDGQSLGRSPELMPMLDGSVVGSRAGRADGN